MLELVTIVQMFFLPLFLVVVTVLIVAAVLFVVGLLSVLRNHGNRPPQSRTAMILVLALVFASVTGLLGYGAFQIYASKNTWTFTYFVSIQANGTEPEALVVPIPRDESLLAGLHLTAGTANWSFVDTAKGRGLYVRFTDDAVLEASVALFPPPVDPPDVDPTMVAPSTASEFLKLWIFYPGGAGGRLGLSFPSWYLETYLVPGWISVGAWPILPPLA